MIESDQKLNLEETQRYNGKLKEDKNQNWKQESENFRAVLKAARTGKSVPSSQLKDDRIE